MVILGGTCKCKGADLCPRFLSPLSPAQPILYVAEGCSKMGIESWEHKARGYRIQPLSLQTLHQAVPCSLPILNSSASILHSVKELLCFLPEENILPWLLKGRDVLSKDRLKSRRLFRVPPVQRLQNVCIYYVVSSPDAERTWFCCTNSQSILNTGNAKSWHYSEEEWENKNAGYVSWRQFSPLEPRVGLDVPLVLTRHAGAQHQELSGQGEAGRMPWCSSPIYLGVQAEPLGDVPVLQTPWEMSPSPTAPALPRSAQDVLPNKTGAEMVKPDFCNQDPFLKPPASLRMSQLLVI